MPARSLRSTWNPSPNLYQRPVRQNRGIRGILSKSPGGLKPARAYAIPLVKAVRTTIRILHELVVHVFPFISIGSRLLVVFTVRDIFQQPYEAGFLALVIVRMLLKGGHVFQGTSVDTVFLYQNGITSAMALLIPGAKLGGSPPVGTLGNGSNVIAVPKSVVKEYLQEKLEMRSPQVVAHSEFTDRLGRTSQSTKLGDTQKKGRGAVDSR
jgi:hypothetical protein